MFSNRLRQNFFHNFLLFKWWTLQLSRSSILINNIVQIRALTVLLLAHQACMRSHLVVLHLLHHLNMFTLLLLLSWLCSQNHWDFIHFVVLVLCLGLTVTFVMLCAQDLIESHHSSTSICSQSASISIIWFDSEWFFILLLHLINPMNNL